MDGRYAVFIHEGAIDTTIKLMGLCGISNFWIEETFPKTFS